MEAFTRFRMYGTEDPHGDREASGGATIHFSDSIVRCTPLDDQQGWRSSQALLRELEDLTYLQGELAAKNILLRGGIAAGRIYVGPMGIFGPALIEAYLLESKHAQYPRIVLHPDLSNRHATPGTDGLGIYARDGLRLTRTIGDDFQFVDYLRNFPREVHDYSWSDREEIARSYMVPRRESILRQLGLAPALSTVRTKFAWLARYHDDVARELLGAAARDILVYP